MKKLFTLFFALVATTSLWAHDFEVDGIYYNYLDGNNVEVTYRGYYTDSYYNEYAGEVIIPSTVTYNGTTYSVTSIGERAFLGCSSLTSITIPNSVTSIGYRAFYDCSSLTSPVYNAHCFAYLPTSFKGAYVIPEGIKQIAGGAFENCSSLTSITIGNSVTSIRVAAFSYCSSLTSITIGNSVTSIGDAAFMDCSSLTSVTIPNSVTSIGGSAFWNCSSFTSITCEATTPPTLGTNVFYGTKLSAVFIPDNTLSAYQTAWGNEYAFVNNETTLTLHVATPGTLADLIFDAGTRPVLVAKLTLTGTLNYADFTCMRETMTSLVDVDLSGITNTSGVNFNGKARLLRIILPTNLTSIGNDAFNRCSSLTSVTIPNSVTNIGDGAFYVCSSLTSITIPNSVTSIGDQAFYYCSSLTSITIPNSVTSIGEWAFANCSSLTSVTIPNSVTSIGSSAFEDCSSLTSITIPNSVTSIGSSAFSGCSGLTSVTIPNSVTSIGDYAFYNCSGLTSITIPNSVTSIGDEAFAKCSSLTSITIPNSVTSIGHGAFYGCSGLTSPVYNAHCFAYMPTSYSGAYTIPEGIKQIAGAAFEYRSRLTSITIPNSVTTIGKRAFQYCSGLTSITIPNSVTSIGDYAFRDCSGLTSVNVLAEVPPALEGDAFYGDAFYNVSKKIPVYVPCGSVSAYQSAKGWNTFTNIQGPLAMYSIAVDVNDSGMGTAQVDENTICGAQITATANYRYRFFQWNDGNTDNPRTLELTQDTILTAEFAVSYSGQCGDNLYWAYDEDSKKISITGSGDMYDYTKSTQPWLLFQEQITEVTTSNTTTSIGTSAFEGCLRLDKVSLSAAMENVAANAFAGCTRLYHIYCYPTDPPFADESSFANYNVYLHVPCNNKEEYDLDIIWGNFKYIECLSADEVEDTEDVIIESGTTTVIITWPTEKGADTYTIVIKKDGEVFCTLTFNAEGQLLNIAFAPGRNGNHPVQYAEAVANGGYRFTVTGLTESTDYTYNITVKDASNKTIKSHSGKFTTESLTAVENTHSQSPMTDCQKILRNGQLLILRDGVEYNAMGAQIQ